MTWQVQYQPGAGLLAVSADHAILWDVAAGTESITTAWRLAHTAATVPEILTALQAPSTEPSAAAVVLEEPDGLVVLQKGQAWACADGQPIPSRHRYTWSEDLVHASEIELWTGPGPHPPVDGHEDGWLPLVAGVVHASRVRVSQASRWPAAGARPPATVPGGPLLETAHDGGVPATPQPSPEAVHAAAAASVPNLPDVERGEPAPHAAEADADRAADDYDRLFRATLTTRDFADLVPAAGALSPEAHLVPGASDDQPQRGGEQPGLGGVPGQAHPSGYPAPAAPVSGPPQRDDAGSHLNLGEHDGHTWIRPEPVGRRDAEVTLPARVCGSGHPNPPAAEVCGTCGESVADKPVQVVTVQQIGVLRTVDVTPPRVIPVDRSLLLGRQPHDDGADASTRLVQIDDPAGGLSRNHLRISVDGWEVHVTDPGSLNGTALEVPGQHQPVRLRRGQPTAITPGTVLNLADVIRVRFEVG